MAERHLTIRNSTAEFLIFQIENKEQGIEVFYKDENLWCTQKAMAILFDCDRSVITKHLGNIFTSGELNEEAVCAKFAHTASDGKSYQTQFFSLDAMHRSATNSTRIKTLLRQALTDRIDDRELFMKGIDSSYYYEQEDYA